MNCTWCNKTIKAGKVVNPDGWNILNNDIYCSEKCKQQHKKSKESDKKNKNGKGWFS